MNKIAVILSTLVFIVTFPFCICIYIILRLFSFLFYLLAKIKYGSKAFQPSSMDVLAGMSSELSRPYYNVVFSLEGQNADINTIRRHYSDKLFNNVRKQQHEVAKKWKSNLKTYCGYYVWIVNDDFDLKHHIRMVNPEDIVIEQLVETVDEKNCRKSVSMERKLDISNMSWEEIVHHFVTSHGSRELYGMPKWELLVLNENENRYTCLFRVHHTICDGLHFAKMMTKLISDKDVQLVKSVRQNPSSSFFSRVALVVQSFCLLPYGLWAGIVYKDKNPLLGKDLSGRKTYYISKPIPLSKMMSIKENLKVTINDIAVSSVSKALTSHFENISENVTEVTSMIPMSRVSNGEDMQMKNDVAIASVKLPTYPMGRSGHSAKYNLSLLTKFCLTENIEIRKLKSIMRLAIVQSNLNEAKSNPTVTAVSWFLMTLSSHLPAWLSKVIVVLDGITLNVSNVRGPEGDQWSIAKSVVKDLIFLLNDNAPLGLAISVLSFRDVLRVGMIIDDALMTKLEGQNFIDTILSEMDNLQNEACILGEVRKSV